MNSWLSIMIVLYLAVMVDVQAGVLSDFELDVITPTVPDVPAFISDESADCLFYQECESESDEPVDLSSVAVVFYPREDSTLRLDFRYHTTANNVDAYELQMKKVARSLGVYVKQSKYIESLPADELDLTSLYLLYRPASQKDISLELGAGVASLSGNQVNTAFSIYLPIQYKFNSRVSLELSVAITYLENPLTELSSGVVIQQGKLHYYAGYNSLKGPTIK